MSVFIDVWSSENKKTKAVFRGTTKCIKLLGLFLCVTPIPKISAGRQPLCMPIPEQCIFDFQRHHSTCRSTSTIYFPFRSFTKHKAIHSHNHLSLSLCFCLLSSFSSYQSVPFFPNKHHDFLTSAHRISACMSALVQNIKTKRGSSTFWRRHTSLSFRFHPSYSYRLRLCSAARMKPSVDGNVTITLRQRIGHCANVLQVKTPTCPSTYLSMSSTTDRDAHYPLFPFSWVLSLLKMAE